MLPSADLPDGFSWLDWGNRFWEGGPWSWSTVFIKSHQRYMSMAHPCWSSLWSCGSLVKLPTPPTTPFHGRAQPTPAEGEHCFFVTFHSDFLDVSVIRWLVACSLFSVVCSGLCEVFFLPYVFASIYRWSFLIMGWVLKHLVSLLYIGVFRFIFLLVLVLVSCISQDYLRIFLHFLNFWHTVFDNKCLSYFGNRLFSSR